MIVLAILAELADLATYRVSTEQNPLVLGLGAAAPVAKLLLVVAIVALAVALGLIADRRCAIARRVLLGAAIVVGAFGAWTNLA